MMKTLFPVRLAGLSVAAMLSVGCVSTSDLDALRSETMASANEAKSMAAEALAAANEAKAMAAEANACCTDNRDRINRAFSRAMLK